MRKLNVLNIFTAVLAMTMLAGCGGGASFSSGSSSSGGSSSGGSSSGGSSSGGTVATPAHISIVSDSPTISATNATATITATVTDSNNLTIAGATVALTASCTDSGGAATSSCGALTVASTTTDSSGNITATLNQGSAAGGDTITVKATTGSVTPVTVDVAVTATPVLKLGTLDSSTGTFTAGAIAIGQTPLAAAGNSGLTVNIVDTANGNAPFQGSATVTFTSPCQSANTSSITSPVTTTTGTVNSNYVAKGCSGNDLITATAVANNTTLPTATGTINVQAATLGGIQFVSATPNVIGLSGTGQTESSVVVFKVVDSSGNPVIGAPVTFGLSTSVGGITFTPASANSDGNGLVQTTVNSGTVHTQVTVKATTTSGAITKTTQSNNLIISVGEPSQNGFSLSAASLNIEGNNVDGTTTTITARLSDRYNNPVPDGTPVSFSAECGHIDSQCTTTNSACTVTYVSQSPRTSDLYSQYGNMNAQSNADAFAVGNDDHRCSILAYANGEESFNDANSNGLYDAGEFFVARPEAFLDSNEDGTFNLNGSPNPSDEVPTDFNKDGTWNNPVSTQFVGLLCNSPANANPANPGACPGGSSLNVFKNIVVVLASGSARIGLADPTPANNGAIANPPLGLPSATVASKGTYPFTVLVTDTAGQPMPVGTTVVVTTSFGSVGTPSSFSVANSSADTVETDASTGVTYPVAVSGLTAFPFSVTGPGTGGSGIVNVTVTSPGGVVTVSSFTFTES